MENENKTELPTSETKSACLPSYTETGEIELKWGTLKGWRVTSDKGKELIKKYHELGASFSAMAQRDTPEQKQIICELIDLMPGDIYLNWDDKYVSKEEAKKYVMEYKR